MPGRFSVGTAGRPPAGVQAHPCEYKTPANSNVLQRVLGRGVGEGGRAGSGYNVVWSCDFRPLLCTPYDTAMTAAAAVV